MKAFRGRHPEITSRRAQLCEAHRAVQCTEEKVQAWVEMYVGQLREVDRLSGGEGKWEGVSGQQLVNIDESGLNAHSPEGGTVAAPAGRRECQKTGSEHGLHVSALFALCADGRCSSPFFVLPGKQAVAKELEADGSLKGVEDGRAYAFADKGNMTTEVRSCVMVGRVSKWVVAGGGGGNGG